jgi:hypothetical protein
LNWQVSCFNAAAMPNAETSLEWLVFFNFFQFFVAVQHNLYDTQKKKMVSGGALLKCQCTREHNTFIG